MNPTINRLKMIFIGVFAVAVVAIWTYQLLWVWPSKDCEKVGGWWDSSARVCAAPLFIPSLTGRPQGMSREDWSKLQAKKLSSRQITDDPYSPTPPPKPVKKPAPAPAKVATPVPGEKK